MSKDNVAGQKFGSLTAEAYSHTLNRNSYWIFKCDCGNTHIARLGVIKYNAKKAESPKAPSCGCIHKEAIGHRARKHGLSKTKLDKAHPLYALWMAVKARCYTPAKNGYHYYGGKGVTMCAEWVDSPEVFIEWCVNNGWELGLQLDKDILSAELEISPAVYSPATCQFVTARVNTSFSSGRRAHATNKGIKLSPDDVAEIKRLYSTGNFTHKAIAEMYNVTRTNISYILKSP